MKSIASIVVLAALSGCASPAEPCEAARAHLAVCLGDSVPETLACDEEQAADVLDLSCAELQASLLDTKSDLFSGRLAAFGCRLGLYHLCEAPVCEAASDEPAPELHDAIPDGASDCARQALEFEGCGACQYYTCREETATCGDDGYLLDFAHRYCNRYRLVSEPEASPAGQAWLRRVRRCLITALDAAETGDDCQRIEEAGLDSHPACYAETGFCDLPVSDWILVFNTIDPSDVRLREILLTSHACLREWLGR